MIRIAHTMKFVFNSLLVMLHIVIKMVNATSLDMSCLLYNLFEASIAYHLGKIVVCCPQVEIATDHCCSPLCNPFSNDVCEPKNTFN